MNKKKIYPTVARQTLAAASVAVLAVGSAAAHGVAGKRFFPATLATD